MTATRRSGGGWTTNTVNRRRSGGGWADIQNGYRRSGGGWALIYSALSGSASGSSTSFNLGNSTTPRTRIMSTGATASASGGGSISYQWSIAGSSNIAGPTLSGANSATCSVQGTITLNTPGTVDLICVISNGGASITVSARLNYNYFNTL